VKILITFNITSNIKNLPQYDQIHPGRNKSFLLYGTIYIS